MSDPRHTLAKSFFLLGSALIALSLAPQNGAATTDSAQINCEGTTFYPPQPSPEARAVAHNFIELRGNLDEGFAVTFAVRAPGVREFTSRPEIPREFVWVGRGGSGFATLVVAHRNHAVRTISFSLLVQDAFQTLPNGVRKVEGTLTEDLPGASGTDLGSSTQLICEIPPSIRY